MYAYNWLFFVWAVKAFTLSAYDEKIPGIIIIIKG